MRHDDRFPPEVEEALRDGALDELLFRLQGPGIVLLDPTPVPVERDRHLRPPAVDVARVAPRWLPVATALLVATAVLVLTGIAWWLR